MQSQKNIQSYDSQEKLRGSFDNIKLFVFSEHLILASVSEESILGVIIIFFFLYLNNICKGFKHCRVKNNFDADTNTNVFNKILKTCAKDIRHSEHQIDYIPTKSWTKIDLIYFRCTKLTLMELRGLSFKRQGSQQQANSSIFVFFLFIVYFLFAVRY